MLKSSSTLRYAVLSVVVLLAIIAYTVYWFALAGKIERGIAAWAEARRAEGMVVKYDTLEVTGFPLRVQPQAANVHITAPGQHPMWGWRSALLTGNILPYNLNHIVFNAPQPQEISLQINGSPREQYVLAPQSAFASVALKQDMADRLDVDIRDGTLRGGNIKTGALTFERAQLHLRAGADGAPQGLHNPALFDISLKLENMDYPGFAGSALGPHLSHMAATASIEGTWPAEKGAAGVRQWRDAGGVAQIRAMELDWGPLKLKAAGTLALDDKDRMIGSLTSKLAVYEGLIKGLQDAGQLKKDEAGAARIGLGIIAIASGGKDGELSLPLVLQDGEMFVGPLRIAKLKPLF
ncbi:MAG: DUF2125 domain-containing protein [Alphaproteobacteria bacterium]|nr:DUF2125 domain-containing protein [Alphaproteobacteria bacterium]